MVAYMRLFVGLPGVTMEDGEAFWIVCAGGAPGNTILRARWPGAGVEDRIDSLLAAVGEHVAEIDWLTFPGDEPASLRQRLAARGMPAGPGGHWLWADLRTLGPVPAVPEGFQVRQVQDDAALEEWEQLSSAGFGGELGRYFDAYARHGYGPEAYSLHFTGYLDGTPVTTATLLDAGGTASLYDISTPPEHRRRGFGAAITHALMQVIRARGYGETWIWSSDVARRVYQRLGYVDADFGVREYKWRRG
jgi:ribosomal protein S18 acetylase RimI-like enzyme